MGRTVRGLELSRTLYKSGVHFNPVRQQCWFVSGARRPEDIRATVERAGEALALVGTTEGGNR